MLVIFVIGHDSLRKDRGRPRRGKSPFLPALCQLPYR